MRKYARYMVVLVVFGVLFFPSSQAQTVQASGITCDTSFAGFSVTPTTIEGTHYVSCTGVVANIFLYGEVSSTKPYADYKTTHCYNTNQCIITTHAPYRAGFWKFVTSASTAGVTITPTEYDYFCNATFYCAERP